MISVCIATYNGEEYIKTQLISIINQLSEVDEIIISDDGSSDNTLKIVSELNDPRIRVFKNNFRDPAKNFEYAIKKSKGEYIFLSDQDDFWDNSKVETVLDLLKNYDCVIHDGMITDRNLIPINRTLFQTYNSDKGVFKNIIKNTYVGCCMAFKRQNLDFLLPFPKKLPMHDSWIGILSDILTKNIFIDKILISFRRHESNASATGDKSNRKIILRLYERTYLIIQMLIRIIKYKFLRKGNNY